MISMDEDIKYCAECGDVNVHLHHIVFKSECKPLENCKLNFVYLCIKHHQDHKEGVHHNYNLNRKYKLKFQNSLEILWDKQYLTREEINEVLGIADKPLDGLLKVLTLQNGKYVREDIIRACMGGKLIIEENKNEKVKDSI